VQEASPSLLRPLKELKGFKKVFLHPGEKQNVSVVLDRNAFAHYDPDKKAWVADKGAYQILVGSSSRDLLLGGKFKLAETMAEK
jgi:beta-glucosidase